MNRIVFKIFVNDVLFIETFRKTTIIHTTIGKYEVKGLAISKILDSLNSQSIIQTHKSYIVSTMHISNIDKKSSSWEIHFKEYNEIALVGDKYKSNVIELLSNKMI